MANLKDIKRRIQSVKSTQKITNAMKLVSAAKFARANHAVENARPYAQAFEKMVQRLIAAQGEQSIESVLLKERPQNKVLLVVFATDRGLCGGLNSNLFKKVQGFIASKREEGIEVDLQPMGRRAISFAKKTGLKSINPKERVLERPGIALAQSISQALIEEFTAQSYDAVFLAFAEYKSALEQIPRVQTLLPVSIDQIGSSGDEAPTDVIVEPELNAFVDDLLERRIQGSIYNVLLNGSASEHGARMTAMDSATNNAKEVIRKLTLEYNRARQAAITTELTEIISGAEALN